MTDTDAIFRREALDSWTRGRNHDGGAVRLGAPWLPWLYRLAVLVLAGAVLALWLVRTDELVSGPALVDGRTGSVTVLLPAASAGDLAGASGVRVDIPGPEHRSLPVVVQQARQADDTAIRAVGLHPLAQPGILLTGRLQDRHAESVAGGSPMRTTASAVLRSERLGDLLGRQFRRMLGDTGGRP